MKPSTLRIEWPTLALIVATYGAWFVAGAVLYPMSAVVALMAMAVLNALHSSLVHEVIHGHPTRNARLNAALVFINIGLIWPFQRYRKMHLNHHADDRLTDPFGRSRKLLPRALYLRHVPPLVQSAVGPV